MLTLKTTTDQGQVDIQLPACWDEVTVGQYQQMANDWDGKDLVHLFSILSGIPIKAIEGSTDYALEEKLVTVTRFIFSQTMDFKNRPLPTFIQLKGKDIPVSKDLARLTIGQSIEVRLELDRQIAEKKERATYESVMSLALAVYCQPFMGDTGFDIEEAKELEKEILKEPIHKLYTTGFFLLKRLMNRG